MTAAAVTLIVSFTLLATGLALPSWAPPGLAFGVRVPSERLEAPVVRAWRRAYRIGVAACGAAAIVVAAGAAAERRPVVATLATVALVPSILLFYLLAHRAVLAARDREDWYADTQPARSADLSMRTAPQTFPWPWLMPAALVILATAAIGAVRYPHLPRQLVLHETDGRADRLVDATVLTAFAPVLIQIGLFAILAALAWLAIRTPSALDPSDARRAARIHETFGYAISRALLILAACASAGLSVVAQQLWRSDGSPALAAVAATVLTALGVLGVVATAAYVGGWARRQPPTPGADARLALGDDRFWRGGLIYANREDPALLVPKRFGIGWTLNFGHPLAWLILAAILAVPVVTTILGQRG